MGNKKLKSIVLVPDFKATQRLVSLWARNFAQRGYVAVIFGNNKLGDSPVLQAKALVNEKAL